MCPEKVREPGGELGGRRGTLGACAGWLGLQKERRVDGAEQRGKAVFAGGVRCKLRLVGCFRLGAALQDINARDCIHPGWLAPSKQPIHDVTALMYVFVW